MSLTEPLPPIASPAEVKDSEVTEVTSDSVENAELTMKENKQADPVVQFGEVYFVLAWLVQIWYSNYRISRNIDRDFDLVAW